MEKINFEVALIKCWFCGEDKGLIMNTRLTKKDAQQIRNAHGRAIDLEPCDSCKKLMEQGIMLFEIEKVPDDPKELPERTGRLAVVRDNAFDNFPDKKYANQVLKRRFGFIQAEIWEKIGLGGKDVLLYSK